MAKEIKKFSELNEEELKAVTGGDGLNPAQEACWQQCYNSVINKYQMIAALTIEAQNEILDCSVANCKDLK